MVSIEKYSGLESGLAEHGTQTLTGSIALCERLKRDKVLRRCENTLVYKIKAYT